MPPVDGAVRLRVSRNKAARPLRAVLHEIDLHIEALRQDRADNFRDTFLRIEHEHTPRQWRRRVQRRWHER